MRADVGHCLAGDGRVEPPPRPHERLPRDGLFEVMHAPQNECRLLGRSAQPAAEDLRVAYEFALEQICDLVSLGHHVPRQHFAQFRVAEQLFQFWEVGVFDDPGLVREDVEAVGDRVPHQVDLRAVPAREHHRVPRLLADEAVEPVRPGAEVHFPGGRVVAARVESREAFDVSDRIAVERAVNVAATVDSQNHPLLHEGGVKVTWR